MKIGASKKGGRNHGTYQYSRLLGPSFRSLHCTGANPSAIFFFPTLCVALLCEKKSARIHFLGGEVSASLFG